jgi:hypothetical protein
MKFSGKNPALRVAAKRYAQSIDDHSMQRQPTRKMTFNQTLETLTLTAGELCNYNIADSNYISYDRNYNVTTSDCIFYDLNYTNSTCNYTTATSSYNSYDRNYKNTFFINLTQQLKTTTMTLLLFSNIIRQCVTRPR